MGKSHPEPERGYLFGVLIPAICSVAITTAYSWSQYDSRYQSEYFTDESAVEIGIMMSIANAIFIGVLSLTLFLNRSVEIKRNITLSALAWLALPGTWICYLIWKDHSVFVLINTLPYALGLLVTFRKFRKRCTSASL
jgi:hypothetical protein